MAYMNQPSQYSNTNLVQYQNQPNSYQNNGAMPARNQSMTTFPTWSQDGNNAYNWQGMQPQQSMTYYGNGQVQYHQANQNYGQTSGRQVGQAQSMTNFYNGGAQQQQPMAGNQRPGQAPGFFYAPGSGGPNVQMQPQQQQQQPYNGQPQQMQASNSQVELSRSNSNRNLSPNDPQAQPAARSASQNVGIAPTATSSKSSIQQQQHPQVQQAPTNTAMIGGGEGNFQQGSQQGIAINPYAANSGDNSENGVTYIPMSWSELLGGGQDGFQNMKVIMSAPTGSDSDQNQNHQLRLAFGPQDVETQPGEIPLKVLAINPVQGYEMSPVAFGEQGEDAQNGTSGMPVQIKANAAYGSDPESLESSINAMSLNGGLRPVNITTSANFGPSPQQTSGGNSSYVQNAPAAPNSPRQGVQMQQIQQQVRNMAPAGMSSNVQAKHSVSSLHGRKRPQQQIQSGRKSDFAGTKYY